MSTDRNAGTAPASSPRRPKGPTSLAVAGNCHRVAVAVEDLDGTIATWKRVFGLGLMLDPVYDDLDKSGMGIVWAGNMPLLALSSTDPNGTVGRYLARNGPGVQSLAWEIDDMWGTDHRLRANGITVTGVHIEGRHFFMHPRDTFGLLLEFTDDRLPHDPRNGDEAPVATTAIIPVAGIAWVSAVVPDLDALVEQFRLIFGIEPEFGTADDAPGDRVANYRIGDLGVRVIEPADANSPYAASLARGSGRLHSVALAATDFSSIDASLERAGLRVSARTERSVSIDPSDMHGVRVELCAAGT